MVCGQAMQQDESDGSNPYHHGILDEILSMAEAQRNEVIGVQGASVSPIAMEEYCQSASPTTDHDYSTCSPTDRHDSNNTSPTSTHTAPSSSHSSSPVVKFSNTESPPHVPRKDYVDNSDIDMMKDTSVESSSPVSPDTNAKSPRCVRCDQAFTGNSGFTNLKRHQRTAKCHQSDANHRCSRQGCQRRYRRLDNLNKHMR